MAQLYDIAEYSLNQLTEVTQEKACTSVLRKWEVPGSKGVVKETLMRTTLISSDQKKGMPPKLYDARLNFNQIKNVPSTLKLKSQLLKIDNSLTKYDLQLIGCPLSYQLPPIDINVSILSNLDNLPDLYDNAMEQEHPKSLPVTKIDWDYDIFEHALILKHEFLQKLKVNHTESQPIQKSTKNKGNQKNEKNP